MEIPPPTRKVAGAIEIFDNAISNASEILATINGVASWDEARVGDQVAERNPEIRDNDVHWINPFDFRVPINLYEFVRNVWHYINDYGIRYDRSFTSLESVNVNRYLPGQRYHVHADAAGKSPRVISALVYLNDDFTGGETEFVHFDERVTPQAGRLVIFPSNYAYAHAALPPTQGIKYSAAFWTNA
jgi:hypothetical protein